MMVMSRSPKTTMAAVRGIVLDGSQQMPLIHSAQDPESSGGGPAPALRASLGFS